MIKKWKYIGALLLVVTLVAVSLTSAFTQSDKPMKGGPKGPMGGCLDQLTEEQREALNQLMEDLKESGATHEEIREAVQQFLEDQGIDTESCGMNGEHRGPMGPMGGCFDQLTEEQREALNQLMEDLKESGATHEEIREAVQQFLEDQGIDTESCGN